MKKISFGLIVILFMCVGCITLPKKIICPTCGGSGTIYMWVHQNKGMIGECWLYLPNYPDEKCRICHGTGIITVGKSHIK